VGHSCKANPHVLRVRRLAVGHDKDLNFVRRQIRHQREVYSNVCTTLIACIQEKQPNWHIQARR
jgi:hypothetical protein